MVEKTIYWYCEQTNKWIICLASVPKTQQKKNGSSAHFQKLSKITKLL